MAIWCILPAPLFMSNDPRTMPSRFESILLNRDAIAINQDRLALPGERIFHNETFDLWRRELLDNKVAIVVLNRQREKSVQMQIAVEQIANEKMNGSSQVEVLDVFRGHSTVMPLDRSNSERLNWIHVSVPPTAVAMLRLTPL